jgi:uncharacterized protein (TIGR00266 family)
MRYTIQGDNMPVAICELENGESMICEAGAMSWMSSNMEMQTSGGGLGKMFGRLFSGESMFQNTYTAHNGNGMIAFTSCFPGNIIGVEITPDRPIIIQKKAFLAMTTGIDMDVFFQKKLGTALFGGEGFIMQKLSGRGTVLLEIDGSAITYDLRAGEKMIISTGHLAMMDDSVQMDIQQIKGVKNALFGGEDMFNTVVTGPGAVTVQTMPMSDFASEIAKLIPMPTNSNH